MNSSNKQFLEPYLESYDGAFCKNSYRMELAKFVRIRPDKNKIEWAM